MTFIDYFRQQFMKKGPLLVKMLSRIPQESVRLSTHPKSMDMKRLATHIADPTGLDTHDLYNRRDRFCKTV
jgi:hypothetical protein